MLSEKKLNRIMKVLDQDTVKELEAKSSEGLKASIAQAEGSVKSAQDELEANPKYVDLKEDLKAISAGLKEVTKRQKAITQYALHLLEESGK